MGQINIRPSRNLDPDWLSEYERGITIRSQLLSNVGTVGHRSLARSPLSNLIRLALNIKTSSIICTQTSIEVNRGYAKMARYWEC